jgi:hypothetical protein
LSLKYDELLSRFALNVNWRLYMAVASDLLLSGPQAYFHESLLESGLGSGRGSDTPPLLGST